MFPVDSGAINGQLGPEVRTPGGPPLEDGQVACRDDAFDADLVNGVRRHACGTPPLHSGHVQVG